MNIGSTNGAGTWQIQLASNTLGPAKPLSELFSTIYSEEDRKAIVDRQLQSVEKSDASREVLVNHATESIAKYKQKIEQYTNLLQTQSDSGASSESIYLRDKIEEYQANMDKYQSQMDYFESNPVESDAVRNHLFEMAAALLGMSTQEVVDGYEQESNIS